MFSHYDALILLIDYKNQKKLKLVLIK